MNRYMNLAHLARRLTIVNEQLRRTLFQSSDYSVLMVNKNGLMLSNQRNHNLAYQNSRGLAKDFKKSSRFHEPRVKQKVDPASLFKSVKIEPNLDDQGPNLGEELGGKLEKHSINKIFIDFRENSIAQSLAAEKGLNAKMFSEAVLSFRQYCIQSNALPVDLHIKLSDVINNAVNQMDLFPYFLQHAYQMFPHLNCMEDLKKLSDLTEPTNWYKKARESKRKIVYHAGPTNSGKTYSALQQFQTSKSGVYCGPLKLLASEVYNKTNKLDTKCDLITGEERKFANEDQTPAEHVACTVEMVNLDKEYEIAVIDEIQLISDLQRGWAWTRAFLGLSAKEIHVCGDMTAVDIVSDLAFLCGDTLEIRNYQRLTQLNIMENSLESFDAIEPGDCIVCFNKNDIFSVTKILEKKGHDVAVIYGSMPPGVKMTQAARFNNPKDKCKILVATDAIGMGLNLSIKRIVFYSIKKPQTRDDQDESRRSESSIEYITTSQALQIAGRAGRFNTQYADGYVTTFFKQDLSVLKEILKKPLQKTTKAGLHPTADQIELFAYQLPNHSLSDLIQIFMSICKIDNGQYFMCNFEEIKNLAELIDHIPIPIRAKYTFAISPINLKHPFVSSCFVKFVRSYSNNDPVTIEYLKNMIRWPLEMPSNLNELVHLENVFDVLDLYLWLGFRFPLIFCQPSEVIQLRSELEKVIYAGVKNLLSKDTNKYSKNSETNNVNQPTKTGVGLKPANLNLTKTTNINNLLNRMKLSQKITELNDAIEPDLSTDQEKPKSFNNNFVSNEQPTESKEIKGDAANDIKFKYDELKNFINDKQMPKRKDATSRRDGQKKDKPSSSSSSKKSATSLDLSLQKLQQKKQKPKGSEESKHISTK